MLAVELANYLDSLDLLTFDESGTTGDTFLNVVPATPDDIVVITAYPGIAPDPQYGYDRPQIQFRTRAGRDPRDAQQRLEDIYDALQNLHAVTLPGGTHVVSCWAVQSGPAPLGPDANGRTEYTQNYQFEVRNVTTHRA